MKPDRTEKNTTKSAGPPPAPTAPAPAPEILPQNSIVPQNASSVRRKTLRDISRLLYRGARYVAFHSRTQFLVITIVFFSVLIFSGYLASLIRINDEDVAEFLSALSQTLAALLGLMIVFLIFVLQLLDQKRDDAHQALRSEIKVIVDVMTEQSANTNNFYKESKDNVLNILNFFEPLQVKNILSDWDKINSKSLEFLRNWSDLKVSGEDKDEMYHRQITLSLKNIRHFLRTIHRIDTGMDITGLMRRSVTKLSLLLGASLVLIVAFRTDVVSGSFPDLNLPIVFAVVAWLIIVLLELVIRTRDIFNNIKAGI